MPDKLKKLVRARMQKTGESHQTALRHVRAQAPTTAKPGETIMYVEEANIIVDALEALIPGTAKAVTGPGPTATVRFYVEGTPIVFSAILSGNRIISQAVTEPQGGIIWGIKEYPLTEDGARQAADYMIAWLSTQIDAAAIETEFNSYRRKDLRWALHHVGEHPLRGTEKSYDAVTGSGKIKDGEPVAGVRIRRDGDSYRFRLLEVSGENYSWDEITMKTTSFAGFVHAIRDILARNSILEQEFRYGATSFTYQYDPQTTDVMVQVPGHPAIRLDRVGAGYGTPRGVVPAADAIDQLCQAIYNWRQKHPRGPLPKQNEHTFTFEGLPITFSMQSPTAAIGSYPDGPGLPISFSMCLDTQHGKPNALISCMVAEGSREARGLLALARHIWPETTEPTAVVST